MLEMSQDYASPIEAVWTALTRPELRGIVMGVEKMEPEPLQDGRMGRDAVYVCYHGRGSIRHTIVDWDPPYRYVFHSPLPGGMSMLVEYTLEALDETTTRVNSRAGSPTGGALRAMMMKPVARRIMAKGSRDGFENLGKVLASVSGAVG